MKKILITGAGGFVGSRILQQWQGKYELCALPKGFFSVQPMKLSPVHRWKLCIGCDPAHRRSFRYQLLCAASGRSLYRANVELPVWLARAAQQTKAKLVAFSSDQVYCWCAAAGARCRKHWPCIPTFTANTSWKQSSVCWSSARTRSICVPVGCMTCRLWAAHPGQSSAESSACRAEGEGSALLPGTTTAA